MPTFSKVKRLTLSTLVPRMTMQAYVMQINRLRCYP